MEKDILSFASVLHIKNKTFICEFDHKSIDLLQNFSDCGFYKIYHDFIENNSDLFLKKILTISVYKHHNISGVAEMTKLLSRKKIEILMQDYANLKLSFKKLLPNTAQFCKTLNISPQTKQNSDYYNFEEMYSVAGIFLNWSDTEFWNSTPRKLCFAIMSYNKFYKEKEKFNEKNKLQQGLNTLKSINNILH